MTYSQLSALQKWCIWCLSGACPRIFYYYVGDHLGTARLITNASGTVCYDADYAPFGQEIAYTNTCTQNYKFTGMERDTETGNDHTWFRGYEYNLGRWMSPDPAGRATANPTDPQSLNRYAYVTNNPLALTDPMGLDACQNAPDPRVCRIENYYDLAGSPGLGMSLDQYDLWQSPADPCSDPVYAESNVICGPPPPLGPPVSVTASYLGGGLGSGPLSGDYGAGLPPLGQAGGPPCEFGDCRTAVPGTNGFQIGEEAIPIGYGIWELVKDAVFWGAFAFANSQPKPKVRTVQDVLQHCTPGARVEEPATGRDYKGGTSIEQTFFCSDGQYTIHWIEKGGSVVHGPHIRPGPPRGGGAP